MIRTLILFLPMAIFALPSGQEIIYGDMNFSQDGNHYCVTQKSDQALVYWQDFSIDFEEVVRFHQPNRKSAILNQVISDSLSCIDGQLKANGHVYLVNPNGILIGPTGKIQAGRFVAACLGVSEFLSDSEIHFAKDKKAGDLIHMGEIASDNEIYLIAKTIDSIGELKGKIVGLIGAEDVFLKEKDGVLGWVHIQGEGDVNHSGRIEAIQAEVTTAGGSLYPLAVNHEGITDAKGVEKQGGKVILSSASGMTTVSGMISAPGGEIEVLGEAVFLKETANIDASSSSHGGQVLVGGDYQGKNPNIPNAKGTYIEPGSHIRADAKEEGEGGKVILWADHENWFYGDVSAKGGERGGNGGFVEVSSPGDLKFKGKVNTTAKKGNTGTLLLDPSDISVTSAASNPTLPTTPPGTYDPNVANAVLDAADVQTTLATNNVTILTATGAGGNGTVKFGANITWNAATTLTVTADQNIGFSNSTISNTHTGSGNFDAMVFTANAGLLAANFTGIALSGSTLSSAEGNIFLAATGGTTLANRGIEVSGSTISSTGTGADAANITLNGRGAAAAGSGAVGVLVGFTSDITTIDGNINLIGLSNGTANFNYGIHLFQEVTVQSTGTGANAGTITLNGTGSAGVSENHGVRMELSATINSAEGDIGITGLSNGTGNFNQGLSMDTETSVVSSAFGVGAALVTINATSGTGSTENHGITMSNSSTIGSEDGDIDITTTSLGTTTQNHGIFLSDSGLIISKGLGVNAANININATPGVGSVDNIGVREDVSSNVTSAAGTINIIGGFLLDTN